MTKTNYTGYSNETHLPIKAGMIVKLPKNSLYDCNGNLFENKKNRSIKVDHVLPGQSIVVGYFHHATREVHLSYTHQQDAYLVEKIYGTDDLMKLWPQMTVEDHGHYSTIFLPISNPQVSWVGSGGYWCRADLNQFDF